MANLDYLTNEYIDELCKKLKIKENILSQKHYDNIRCFISSSKFIKNIRKMTTIQEINDYIRKDCVCNEVTNHIAGKFTMGYSKCKSKEDQLEYGKRGIIDYLILEILDVSYNTYEKTINEFKIDDDLKIFIQSI